MRRILQAILAMSLGALSSGAAGEIQQEGYVTRSALGPHFLFQPRVTSPAVLALTDPFQRLAAGTGKLVVIRGNLERDALEGLPHVSVRAAFPGSWLYPAAGLRLTRDTDGDARPDVADTDDDNDGMDDDYEYGSGLDPFRDDAGEDLDRDGMVNGEEAVAGTRANDAGSVFRLLRGQALLGEGGSVLTWLSVPGKRYVVWGASQPQGPYQPFEGDVPADTGAEQTSLSVTNAEPGRYYRIEVIRKP